MWILINWANDNGSDILPVNETEGEDDVKQFNSEQDALQWASKNLNFNFKAIKI